jgi:hypothetical protein
MQSPHSFDRCGKALRLPAARNKPEKGKNRVEETDNLTSRKPLAKRRISGIN